MLIIRYSNSLIDGAATRENRPGRPPGRFRCVVPASLDLRSKKLVAGLDSEDPGCVLVSAVALTITASISLVVDLAIGAGVGEEQRFVPGVLVGVIGVVIAQVGPIAPTFGPIFDVVGVSIR